MCVRRLQSTGPATRSCRRSSCPFQFSKSLSSHRAAGGSTHSKAEENHRRRRRSSQSAAGGRANSRALCVYAGPPPSPPPPNDSRKNDDCAAACLVCVCVCLCVYNNIVYFSRLLRIHTPISRPITIRGRVREIVDRRYFVVLLRAAHHGTVRRVYYIRALTRVVFTRLYCRPSLASPYCTRTSRVCALVAP